MNPALSPSALSAIQALVGVLLKREREQKPGQAASLADGPPGLKNLLDAIPQQELLATIRRHRLGGLLHGDPLVAKLLPDLAPSIQALAYRDTMAALALASLTREMVRLFDQAAIPLLVIKGIPLALQTTGSLTARGRGDLDLLVDPQQLPEALQTLQQAGFSPSPKPFPTQLNSKKGRYCLWIGYEVSLVRQGPRARQWIDLHWALSNVRGALPSFEELWRCREQLELNGQPLPTLNRLHALHHACAHAAKDQWMSLRHLIDIDRLTSFLSQQDIDALRSHAVVCLSLQVSQSLLASNKKEQTMDHPASLLCLEKRLALARARRSQLLPRGIWELAPNQRWSLRESLSKVYWGLRWGTSPKDWIRFIMGYLLPPNFLSRLTSNA